MKTWRWLLRNTQARLGVLPYRELHNSDKQGSSHVSNQWNVRVYPTSITSPLVLHSRPMMSRMSPQHAKNIDLSVGVVSGETVEFPVFLVSSPDLPDEERPYVSLLQEPMEVIHELYPDAVQLAPLLGVVETAGARLVLTQERPDENSLGRAFNRFICTRSEWHVFTPEALAKAEARLRSVCMKHGFDINRDTVTRGSISINRRNCAVTINGSFRCLTSDHETPPDDQVVQKILSITNKQSIGLINTLSGRDRTLILNV